MAKHRPDCPIAVGVPELIKEHWRDCLLHSFRARKLCTALLVVMVAWGREAPHPEKVIEEEEPSPKQSATAAPQPAQ